MKLNWKILYTGFAAALILTACGTDEGQLKNPSSSDASIEVDEDVNLNASDGETSKTDTEADITEVEGSSDSGVLPEAVTTKSDEQDYSLDVLPGFTLTSEEPGRDSLYSDDKPAAFMRIETQQQEEGMYDYLLDNLQEVLKASSEGTEPTELTDIYADAKEAGMDNVKAFTVEAAEGPVTGVLYEKGDKIVRLTIYDTKEEAFASDFLDMGKTIH